MTCVPTDRPHDPGDAADLNIMGHRLASFRGVLSVDLNFAQLEKKINSFLTLPHFACGYG
ncbi:MAG: hypothetical protein FP819_08085 [Rhizobiaceae bacterium]|nr:hypothetical protein [Rhizobiaceae bacterium]